MKFLYGLLVRLVLHIHRWSYFTLNKLLMRQYGIHPKQAIIRYAEWFQSRISPEDVVLDVGCNTGSMTEIMAKNASYVYGIEIEPSHIQKAKQRKIFNAEFFLADATKFDYGKLRPINVITLSNLLEHIEHRQEFLATLSKRVKWAQGPRFLVRVPLITRDWVPVFARQIGQDYRLDPTHYIEYTVDEFELEIRSAGLSIELKEIRFGELYTELHSENVNKI